MCGRGRGRVLQDAEEEETPASCDGCLDEPKQLQSLLAERIYLLFIELWPGSEVRTMEMCGGPIVKLDPRPSYVFVFRVKVFATQ